MKARTAANQVFKAYGNEPWYVGCGVGGTTAEPQLYLYTDPAAGSPPAALTEWKGIPIVVRPSGRFVAQPASVLGPEAEQAAVTICEILENAKTRGRCKSTPN